MNYQKHYNRLMEFWTDAPVYPVRPDDKYCIFGDSHLGVRDGADDFESQYNIAMPKFKELVGKGFTFILNGDVTELLENKLKPILLCYYELMTLIYSNLAICHTKEGMKRGIGYRNHDAEFPDQAEATQWFNKLVPRPCYWRVARLGDSAYLSHGDLGDFFNDDKNWRPTKWIVKNIWARWQRFRNQPSETSPASNPNRAGDMEASYKVAIAMLGKVGGYNHLHNAKVDGMYVNFGSLTHRGVITYGLVENKRLSLMQTTKTETTCIGKVALK